MKVEFQRVSLDCFKPIKIFLLKPLLFKNAITFFIADTVSRILLSCSKVKGHKDGGK